MFKSKEFLLKGIWLYFFLLVLEGGLRKWFLPGLAGPLLLVRDPLALWMLVVASQMGILYFNPYMVAIMLIGVVGLFTALFLGHGNLWVALYGARIFLIQFPFIFVVGAVMSRNDVLKLGRMILMMTFPMTVIIGLQFFSPQSAWINRGIGGVETFGFQGALGHFRPPGTFSFITGTYLFYGLAFSFIFYYWLYSSQINKLLLISATIGALVAIPLSISRTLFFEVCLTILFAFIAVIKKPALIKKLMVTVGIGFVVIIILSQTQLFQHVTDTFFERFTEASGAEGGLKGTFGDRFLGGLVSAITGSMDLPFFGYGIGMGTNVGAQILAGDTIFLLHEEEWGRIIDELGAVLGLTVVFIRVVITVKIAGACYKKVQLGDILPWMMLSFSLLLMAQGNWAQPTSLGFCSLTTGLMIASLKKADKRAGLYITHHQRVA